MAEYSHKKNIIGASIVTAIIFTAVLAFMYSKMHRDTYVLLEESKNEACRINILNALENFKSKNGLAYTVDSLDAQQLFDTGHLSKEYNRDGIKITCGFGLEQEEHACKLIMNWRDVQDAANPRTEFGDFGSVELEKCKCKKL